MAGRFIVLEGGDGVGKTTQATLLSSWLTAREIPHILTREPGGTPVGEAIREVVLDRDDLEISPESELLLILAARAAFVREVVRPALEMNQVVVADRFELSTLAYQGYGRGLDLQDVRDGLRIATGGLKPDLYVLLNLPAEAAGERRRKDGGAPDRIEKAGDGFLQSVHAGYLALAETEPGVQLLSARGTPEDVHKRIRGLLETRYPETFC